MVVFDRNIEPEYGHLLDWALELGKPVIYELDDNLLEAPDTTPGYPYFTGLIVNRHYIDLIREHC